jgi:hypothetical protein
MPGLRRWSSRILSRVWRSRLRGAKVPGHQEHLDNANGAARRAGPDRGRELQRCRQVLQGYNAVPGPLARAHRVAAGMPGL